MDSNNDQQVDQKEFDRYFENTWRRNKGDDAWLSLWVRETDEQQADESNRTIPPVPPQKQPESQANEEPAEAESMNPL